MRNIMVGFVAIVVACPLAGCGGEGAGGGASVTAQECRTAFNVCLRSPVGVHRLCMVTPDFQEDALDRFCAAHGAEFDYGETFACLAENADLCREQWECSRNDDAPCADAAEAELDRRCPVPDPPVLDLDCERGCYEGRGTCTDASPTDTFASCADYSLDCERAFRDCLEACPPA